MTTNQPAVSRPIACGFILAGVFLCGSPAYSGAPDVTAQRCEAPLRLDGNLGEACWQKAQPQSEFTLYKKKGQKLDDTDFRLAYDDTWFYIGLRCGNPLQKLVFTPKITEHDGPVHTDESVEIFLDPGTGGELYYHFLLSCFNIKAEQCVRKKVSDRRWNHPWRSATRIDKTGWTAELAIPLYLMASYGDLDRMRMNMARNRRAPSMDAQAVITHDDMYSSSWKPVVGSFHEANAFGRIAPLQPGALQIPFTPFLERMKVGACYVKGSGQFFDVESEVRGATVKSGELELIVEDQPVTGKGTTLRERFVLAGREMKHFSVAVPMKSIADRRVEVTLRDATTGEVWGRRLIENPPALNVLNTYLDRNYYTSEKEAVLVAAIGLPPESLKTLTILVRGPDGSVLARGEKVAPETQIAFPLAKMDVGVHTVKMELRPRAGGENSPAMLSEELQLTKRAPKPGREWKIDQINRVLLNNGEPIFPFGPVMAGCKPDNEAAFKQLADAGFNTFFQWHRYLPPADTIKYIKMAKKHGLYAVTQLETGWSSYRSSDLKLPEKYLNEAESKKLLGMWQTGSIYIRAFLMKAQSATYAQRTAIFEEYYHKNVDRAEQVVRSVMEEDNLIGYNTFDEACANRWFRISDSLARLYRHTHKTDGYHPVMFVSGKEVPEDRVYEGAADVFLPDPYWHPTSNIRDTNKPNIVSKRMYLSSERNKRSRKVLCAVPVGWVWSGILAQSKRAISGAEQHCQNFLAIIHGVRGLFWFRWPMHEVGWRNLTRTAGMIKVIGPMAVQPRVKQTMRYEKVLPDGARKPVPFDPKEDIYPDVQGCVFRDPGGGLVLVAANSSYCPVRAEFSVSGLKRNARRVFADVELATRDSGFTEDLEPLAVRAYRLGDLAEPLALTITAQRPEKLPPREKPAYMNKWRPGRKNILPNPSFEEETMPGIPDYYIPIEAGVAIERNAEMVKFGAKSVRLDTDTKVSGVRGILGLRTAPQVEKVTPCVWSVWLRGKNGGENVQLSAGSAKKKVKLEKDWKRYSLPLTIKPGLTLRYGLGLDLKLITNRHTPTGTCWVDGMQLEQGEEMTPFEE